jgi:hypothetical protein
VFVLGRRVALVGTQHDRLAVDDVEHRHDPLGHQLDNAIVAATS